MPEYRHTQVGAVMLAGVVVVLVAAAAAAAPGGYTVGEAVVVALLPAVLLLLATLTVEVKAGVLRVWFGPGWIRRTVPLREIESAAAVRVPWYVGWGIRWTFRYWLFNVSGRRAVLLQLKDGRRFAFGTDEPDAVLEALRRAGVAVASGE